MKTTKIDTRYVPKSNKLIHEEVHKIKFSKEDEEALIAFITKDYCPPGLVEKLQSCSDLELILLAAKIITRKYGHKN